MESKERLDGGLPITDYFLLFVYLNNTHTHIPQCHLNNDDWKGYAEFMNRMVN